MEDLLGNVAGLLSSKAATSSVFVPRSVKVTEKS